ncbi:MAG: molybdopterin-dependent oxidoreductase, partial [Acidobacteria bacterium]|nr:molybdopterin-dependent oxidoreductase [Acidobacteriota bacterium]
VLKGGLAMAGLGVIGVPEWAFPALAQGETLMQFTDVSDDVQWIRDAERRIIDVRQIDGPFTPRDQFFTTQHYGHPNVDVDAYRLRVSGLVDTPLELSMDDLRAMPSRDLVFGFECSGNRGPLNGLSSNGRWTGVSLRTVLQRAGVQDAAREFVFFGADRGEEEVIWRGRPFNVEQQYGRSLERDQALSDEPLLAYAMNGDPLTEHQGRPLRLLVPGWYGAPNVKWVAEINVQKDQYLGRWQARSYRTLQGQMINGELKWVETAISTMNLKSYIARVTAVGGAHNIFGVVLNDGTPIERVEVKIDDGEWQAATLDPETMREKYGWKFFNYRWDGATPGEHTVVSRVTDVNGNVQPTAEGLADTLTFLEAHEQFPRNVIIA